SRTAWLRLFMRIFAARGTISLQDVAYTHVYAIPHSRRNFASLPPGWVVLSHVTEGEHLVGATYSPTPSVFPRCRCKGSARLCKGHPDSALRRTAPQPSSSSPRSRRGAGVRAYCTLVWLISAVGGLC